jgi:AGZA family xanthine/uracil permease-like MFS transporter
VGIGAGFVMYVLIKTITGKMSEVHPLMWVVAIAFLIYFGQAVLGQAISA